MPSKTSLPPTFHHPHLESSITPSRALESVSAFLRKSERQPYLHPDCTLSRRGITFSAESGQTGGPAISILRRIEVGLKGESLPFEDVEEANAELAQADDAEAELPAGDDSRLDALLSRASGKGAKRKRSEIEQWAETSSNAALPLAGGEEDAEGQQVLELESFANTPMHASDWQAQEEYEREQRPWEGEVGEREGAPATKQNGRIPEVEVKDDSGESETESEDEDEESGEEHG